MTENFPNETGSNAYDDELNIEALADAIIKITDANSSTEQLTLKDKDNNSAREFKANRGQKIKWVVQTNKVNNIVDITQKDRDGNHNIFSKRPSRVGNSKNFEGTISRETPHEEEWYNIIWEDKDGVERTDDPLIQVNPAIIPLDSAATESR